jgi:hypothetical protein
MNVLPQFLINLAVMLDHAANTLLLGDPDETLSARIARARAAGHPWAKLVCRIFSFVFREITFGKYDTDHCSYSVDNSVLPVSKEIWSWSSDKLDVENVVEDEEL